MAEHPLFTIGLPEIAILLATAIAGSAIGAVAGFGGGVILLPVLVATIGVREAIPVLTLTQLAANGGRVWFNRKELHLPVVLRFAAGAVPGAIVGGVLFATAPAEALVRVLGAFLLVMVVLRHTGLGRRARMPLRAFPLLGAVTALLSAVVGVIGPLSAPFFLSFGLVKGAYIGTEALASLTMHTAKLGVYGGFALVGTRTLAAGALVGAATVLGSYLGKLILDRVPERVFPFIIDGVLIAAGVLFLVRG